MTVKNFGFGTQIRKSPYFNATVKYGAKGFSVYNHMYIPRDFGSPEQNFWNLIENAILCDVAVERQVEITGPDAYKFIQLLTPRDLSKLAVGQCKYVLIVNNDGGILNDPVLLRLDTNHFWLSLADSDVLFWAQGVAINSGLNVKITEPDVSPLQLQGPKSGDIMVSLFGESIKDLKYYWLKEYELDGIPLIVSRTGWSSEHNIEIPKKITKTDSLILSSNSFLDFSKLSKVYFIGNCNEKIAKFINHENILYSDFTLPSALDMAKLSYLKFDKKDFENLSEFQPRYLKDFEGKKTN